jgi:H+/Cl- antiporter ClcA
MVTRMADMTNPGGADPADGSATAAQPNSVIDAIGVNPLTLPNRPKLWAILLIALIAIAFTALWLGAYNWLNSAIWSNSFVTSNRWMIPVGVIALSLLVGLTQKYLRAPTVIHGGFVEAIQGKTGPNDPATFPGTLLSSLLSLVSGASIGPEGAIAFLVLQIATWVREKLKLARSTALGFDVAASASAFNGIIGNPLFTGVLATELQVGGNANFVFLAWNLLAGVVGYLFFTLLALPVFAKYVPFTPITQLTLGYALATVALAFLGGLTAILVGVLFQVFQRVITRVFQERVVWRALAAGVIIGVVCYFVPEVMFSGEKEIFVPIANPLKYGVLLLIGLGLLKLVLLALSMKSGFLGGPTFPLLFACTMFALAVNLLFPSVPISICVISIEGAALSLALGAPLTAILLVATIATSNPYEVALLALAAVVGLLMGALVKTLLAQRAARQAPTSASGATS